MQDLTGFEQWLWAEGKAENTIRGHLCRMRDYFAQYRYISRQNGETWLRLFLGLVSIQALDAKVSAFNVYCKYCGKEEERIRHFRCYLGEKAAAQPCQGCYYRRPLVISDPSTSACHYCMDTGKPRGVPVSLCYGHDGTPYRPEPYCSSSQRPEVAYGKKIG